MTTLSQCGDKVVTTVFLELSYDYGLTENVVYLTDYKIIRKGVHVNVLRTNTHVVFVVLPVMYN